jgi:hypothetical protein
MHPFAAVHNNMYLALCTSVLLLDN